MLKNVALELRSTLIQEYNAVNPERNPVSVAAPDLTIEQLAYVLGQYSWFSKRISTFLLDAYYNASDNGWLAVAEELAQNISEELSAGESCLPHYVLLKQGIMESLEIDLLSVPLRPATRVFINSVRQQMNSASMSAVTGAVYALESSATPELKMVYGWIKRAFEQAGITVSKKITVFFESHIDEIEVLHEGRFREACVRYIDTSSHASEFRRGFVETMEIMDAWWVGLHQESAVQ